VIGSGLTRCRRPPVSYLGLLLHLTLQLLGLAEQRRVLLRDFEKAILRVPCPVAYTRRIRRTQTRSLCHQLFDRACTRWVPSTLAARLVHRRIVCPGLQERSGPTRTAELAHQQGGENKGHGEQKLAAQRRAPAHLALWLARRWGDSALRSFLREGKCKAPRELFSKMEEGAAGEKPDEGGVQQHKSLWGEGSLVTVAYAIRDNSGKEVDTSAARGHPLTFVLGARMACPALDHSVRRMRVGEEAIIKLDSRDALDHFVHKGAAAGSLREELDMWIRVEAVQDVQLEALARMTDAMREAAALKEAGNAKFRAGEHREAAEEYMRAERALQGAEAGQLPVAARDECCALQVSCWLNVAACCIRLENSTGDGVGGGGMLARRAERRCDRCLVRANARPQRAQPPTSRLRTGCLHETQGTARRCTAARRRAPCLGRFVAPSRCAAARNARPGRARPGLSRAERRWLLRSKTCGPRAAPRQGTARWLSWRRASPRGREFARGFSAESLSAVCRG